MDIIKPNSTYPSLHDGLHIYSGSTTLTSDLVLIKTILRQSFYVRFYRTINSGFPGVPGHSSQIEELGYIESTDTTSGGLNYTVKSKSGWTIYYLIIGSHEIRTQPHSEVVEGSGSLDYSQVICLEKIIANAGTSAVNLYDNSEATLTYTKEGTGSYRITSDTPIFNTDKTIAHLTMENDNNLDGTYELRGNVGSTTTFDIKCYFNDNEGDSAIAPIDFPGTSRVFLSIKIYP